MTPHDEIKKLAELGKKATQGYWYGRMYRKPNNMPTIQHTHDNAFCDQAANARPALQALLDDYERLREALENISNLDALKDSESGFNESGFTECFEKAQVIATQALKGEE